MASIVNYSTHSVNSVDDNFILKLSAYEESNCGSAPNFRRFPVNVGFSSDHLSPAISPCFHTVVPKQSEACRNRFSTVQQITHLHYWMAQANSENQSEIIHITDMIISSNCIRLQWSEDKSYYRLAEFQVIIRRVIDEAKTKGKNEWNAYEMTKIDFGSKNGPNWISFVFGGKLPKSVSSPWLTCYFCWSLFLRIK